MRIAWSKGEGDLVFELNPGAQNPFLGGGPLRWYREDEVVVIPDLTIEQLSAILEKIRGGKR